MKLRTNTVGWLRTPALAIFAQFVVWFAVTNAAAQPPTVESAFVTLLTSQKRQTFDAIRDYVGKHLESPDRWAASQWCLHTARECGWEADASEVAAKVLAHDQADLATLQMAREVLALGHARRGEAAGAQTAFRNFLRGIRLRQPNQAADLAQSLALVWQLRQQPDQAKLVYEQLASGFFLNEEIRTFTASRTARLELVGRPASEFTEEDLAGREFAWSEMRGKLVLIDFWATNCRPCLEELPRLKQCSLEFQPLGVEFLGVSFDDDAQLLQSFVAEQKIAWRQILGRKTAEESYSVSLIPCLMIVDRAGNIAAVDVRPPDLSWCLTHMAAKTAEASGE